MLKCIFSKFILQLINHSINPRFFEGFDQAKVSAENETPICKANVFEVGGKVIVWSKRTYEAVVAELDSVFLTLCNLDSTSCSLYFCAIAHIEVSNQLSMSRIALEALYQVIFSSICT